MPPGHRAYPEVCRGGAEAGQALGAGEGGVAEVAAEGSALAGSRGPAALVGTPWQAGRALAC